MKRSSVTSGRSWVVTDPAHPFADFRNFVYAVWKHLGLPDPTPVQYDIAHYLQHGPDRAVIEAFRGVGKSFLTSAFACWCWYWDVDFKVMVVSASKERADAFSQFCLRLILDMPELKHLAPRAGQRRSLMTFDIGGCSVDHSPSLKSVGITGQMTGSRADLIISDDAETPKNSQTQLQRERLRELVKEFDAILKPLPTSRILYLGTPQCEDSLYNELPKRGYDVRIWPARKPSPDQESRYQGRLAPLVVSMNIAAGMPTDPKRFSTQDLDKREASYGRSGFALQFMLDTTLSDGNKYPLRCSDFIVMDVDREVAPVKVSYGSSTDQMLGIPCVGMKGDRWYGPMYVSPDHRPFTDSIMFIDPSGRGDDKTAYCVLKMLNGTVFIRRWSAAPGGYDPVTLTTLVSIAKAEDVKLILVEPNFGDGMFVQLMKPYLQRLYQCGIEDAPRAMKSKEARIIDTLEPVLNQHRLVIDKAIIEADMRVEDVDHQAIHQLTRLTRDKNSLGHDDLIDALAGGVAYFLSRLDVDQTGAEDRVRQEKLDEEIRKLMAAAGKWSSQGNNWMDQV